MRTLREPEPASEPQAVSPAAAEDDSEDGRAAAPARPVSASAARLIFDDPLSQQSPDDTDRGWGERPAGGDSAADLARFLDEKPPHHL
ncbi:hypothetical protein AB0C96_24040 [Streptomyces sp. NPDC048506]|uniref:hypothetical protein n=1 Tax=Streptomyces sp. NPDC048506 TaxID=3155028 RepID=UPI00341FD5C6